MPDTWETAVRTAAATMLRHPERISDGLEAELYALLDHLGTATADPRIDHDTATSPGPGTNTPATSPNTPADVSHTTRAKVNLGFHLV